MKKLIIAFDGAHFSKGAMKFALRLNELAKVLLTGVFLPQTQFASLWSYAEGITGPMYIPLVEKDETNDIYRNIETFESECERNDVEYRVHKDFRDFAIPELLRESRFADLLIIGSQSFYRNFRAEEADSSVAQVLHNVECPVVIVPEDFSFPSGNILAYDGSAHSVFAIKQFAYLFPEFTTNATTLVFASEAAKNEKLPADIYIEELAARHFPNLEIFVLNADPKKYFKDWILEHRNCILVSGSFGRSDLSRFFRKSFVDQVIREHELPVFIAHR